MTRLIHIADLHFGAEDPVLVDAFATACDMIDPDLVIAAGDFTQAGRRREFDAAAGLLASLPAPVVGTPGNHDVPVRSVSQRLASPWRRYRKILGPVIKDRYSTADMQVESLGTARRAQWQPDWSLGRIGRRRLDRILSRFDPSGAQARILTCHHPILSPGGPRGRARTAYAAQAAPKIAQHCDLVLTGHLHETYACVLTSGERNCWFLGAGTTFSHRTRGEGAGFNLITLADDAIETTHYQAGPDRRFRPVSSRLLPRNLNEH